MPSRKHRRGLLTSLVKYPKSRGSHRKEGPLKKIGNWLGWAIIGAALVVMFAVFLKLTFDPAAGSRDGEGTFEVARVEENPPGYRPEERIVAVAVVNIENRTVRIPLRQETRGGVEARAALHVKYHIKPRMGLVTIREWRVQSPPPGAPAPPGTAPGSTP